MKHKSYLVGLGKTNFTQEESKAMKNALEISTTLVTNNQHQIGDIVTHKKYGQGTIVRKIGPLFVKSLNEWTEPNYTVLFNQTYINSLYYNELIKENQ